MSDTPIYDIKTGRPLQEALTPEEMRELLSVLFETASAEQREFLVLYAQVFKRDLSPLPDVPDAEVIRRCEQLCAVNLAIESGYRAFRTDSERDTATEPLDREWWKLKDQIFKCAPPHTREGVAAAAKMLLSYSALDSYAEAVETADVLMWLSRACAEYIAGQVA
jgi:hypothetical protein